MQYVLAIGADPSLLYTRGLVLARTGALVKTAGMEPGLLLLENGNVSILVLCHSLRQGDVLRLCECARTFTPATKILLLDSSGILRHASADVDARFLLEDGPGMLVKCVRNLLKVKPLEAQTDPSAILPFRPATPQGARIQPAVGPLPGPKPRVLHLATLLREAEK